MTSQSPYTIQPTTLLEAVNVLLEAIGRSPVSTLLAGDLNVDVEAALRSIHTTSIDVQKRGWYWNTDGDEDEEPYLLDPDPVTKQITLPENALKCDTTGWGMTTAVIVRGNRLYNKRTRSYSFDEPVQVKLTIGLDFEELPQAARSYIAIRAARSFSNGRLSDEATNRFTAEQEYNALAALEADEDQSDDRTLFEVNPHLRRRARTRRRT